jgi:peptidoglycan hydrolase-like protein with peptidoglycan-binding domain
VPPPLPPQASTTPATTCLTGHLFNILTGARCSVTTSTTIPAGTPLPPAPAQFTKYLTLGTTDPQVLALQKYLNTKGFTIATQGPGSKGKETDFFGAFTKAAVIKYQKAKGIDPIGVVGPATRAALNAGK